MDGPDLAQAVRAINGRVEAITMAAHLDMREAYDAQFQAWRDTCEAQAIEDDAKAAIKKAEARIARDTARIASDVEAIDTARWMKEDAAAREEQANRQLARGRRVIAIMDGVKAKASVNPVSANALMAEAESAFEFLNEVAA